MYDFAIEHPLDLNELRARLRRKSDRALRQFGAATRYMCSAKANAGRPPRDEFVVQVEERIARF